MCASAMQGGHKKDRRKKEEICNHSCKI